MWLTVVSMILSLYVGFAISRNRLCALAAASDALTRTNLSLYAGFGLVIGAATFVVMPLTLAHSPWFTLPRAVIVTGPILFGAAVAGSGVFVNGACPMGTLMRLGMGELQFLFTLVGLAVGFVVLDTTHFLPAVTAVSGQAEVPLAARIAGLAAGGYLYWISDRYLSRRPSDQHRLLRIMMPVLGVVGALLFCLSPHPSYGDAIHQLVAPAPATLTARIGKGLVGGAAIFGALLVAFVNGSFVLRWPPLAGFIRCVLGGFVMAVGSKLMGAGGEELVLTGAPSGAATSVLCLAIMFMTIFGLVGLSQLVTSSKAA